MGAIIPKLAKTHRVYALEFQGHGRTTDIARPITYPNLADDVAAFMDAHTTIIMQPELLHDLHRALPEGRDAEGHVPVETAAKYGARAACPPVT